MKIALKKRRSLLISYSFLGMCETGFFVAAIYSLKKGDIISLCLYITVIIAFLIPLLIDIKTGVITSTIKINKYGITFESRNIKYYIDWEDVKLVGASQYGLKIFKRVVFSTAFDTNLLKVNLQPSSMSNKLIFVYNRKGLLKELRKYWRGTIVGEEKIL